MVLPHPQLHSFEVAPSEHVRVILASDGLWDVCSVDDAARVARQSATAQEAVNTLVEWAEHQYLEVRRKKRVGDDTTILVVDVNPCGLPFEPAVRASICCIQ